MYVTTSVSQLAIIYKSFLFSWQMEYIISLIFENWLLITKKIWLLIHHAHLFCNERFVVIVTTLISLTLINSFSFSQVMPGKYHVKASHSSWTFENVSLQCSTSGKLMVVNYWCVVKRKGKTCWHLTYEYKLWKLWKSLLNFLPEFWKYMYYLWPKSSLLITASHFHWEVSIYTIFHQQIMFQLS